MNWWSKLPSATPLKGFSRFLYVWTHWDTISDDLKKRDERPHAIEEWARQRLRLQEESFEIETRNLNARLAELEELRALAMRAMPSLTQVIEHVKTCQQVREEMFNSIMDTGHALAIMLYIEQDASVRDQILADLSPKSREVVGMLTESIREALAEGHQRKAQLSP